MFKEKLTIDDSINTLQELAQKRYFSIPKHLILEQQSYDINEIQYRHVHVTLEAMY